MLEAERRRREEGQEARETRLQLQRPHHDGHPEQPREAAHPQRDLRVHHDQLPLLQREQTGLAELDPPQPEPQQVLREGAPPLRRPRKGKLLDVGRLGRGRVHRRHDRQAAPEIRAQRPLEARLLQETPVPRRAPARSLPPLDLHAAGRPVLPVAVPEVRADTDEDSRRRASRFPRGRERRLRRSAVRPGVVRVGEVAVGAVRGSEPVAAGPDVAAAAVARAALAARLRRVQPRPAAAVDAPPALAAHLQADHGVDASLETVFSIV